MPIFRFLANRIHTTTQFLVNLNGNEVKPCSWEFVFFRQTGSRRDVLIPHVAVIQPKSEPAWKAKCFFPFLVWIFREVLKVQVEVVY